MHHEQQAYLIPDWRNTLCTNHPGAPTPLPLSNYLKYCWLSVGVQTSIKAVCTVPRGNDVSNGLREAIAYDATQQFENRCETAFKQFRGKRSTLRKITDMLKAFKAVVHLPRTGLPSKDTPKSDCAMLTET